MKVKDIKGNLTGIKVKTPNGVVGYWKSQWIKGVWLTERPDSTRVYPQFIDNLKECLEWEVTEEDSNCHIETVYDMIDNKKKKEK